MTPADTPSPRQLSEEERALPDIFALVQELHDATYACGQSDADPLACRSPENEELSDRAAAARVAVFGAWKALLTALSTERAAGERVRLPFKRGDTVGWREKGREYEGVVVAIEAIARFSDELTVGYQVVVDGWKQRRHLSPESHEMWLVASRVTSTEPAHD